MWDSVLCWLRVARTTFVILPYDVSNLKATNPKPKPLGRPHIIPYMTYFKEF